MNETQASTYLRVELERLQAENTQLHKRLGSSAYHARRVQLAYDDALLLAGWKAAHIYPGRDYAHYHGISQRRWQNAIALLRLARVVQGRRRWATDSLAVIEKRLAKAKDRAVSDPQSFFLYVVRHGRR